MRGIGLSGGGGICESVRIDLRDKMLMQAHLVIARLLCCRDKSCLDVRKLTPSELHVIWCGCDLGLGELLLQCTKRMPEAQLMLRVWPDRSESINLRVVLVGQRELGIDPAVFQGLQKPLENDAFGSGPRLLAGPNEKIGQRDSASLGAGNRSKKFEVSAIGIPFGTCRQRTLSDWNNKHAHVESMPS